MKVSKEKHKVSITCNDGVSMLGYIHINPGERILDFLNDTRENFIVVIFAKITGAGPMHSFQLYKTAKHAKEGKVLFLSKNAINWVEEI